MEEKFIIQTITNSYSFSLEHYESVIYQINNGDKMVTINDGDIYHFIVTNIVKIVNK